MDYVFMDSEWTLKRKRKRCILIVITVVIALFLWSYWDYCAGSRNYPYHVAPMWQCDDPYFLLVYTREENGALTCHEALEWNNETNVVDVGFLMREYDVYPAETSAYADRLFSGTWKYRKGNLVLMIEEDFLFDYQYSELVFSPVSADSQDQPTP